MKDSNLELIVGIGVAIAGMIGIGYAIGTPLRTPCNGKWRLL